MIGGCASNRALNSDLSTSTRIKAAKIKVFTSKHPLYVQWNDKANDFENKIRRKVKKGKLAFRIDNLKPVNAPKVYKTIERSLLWGGDSKCSKYKFGKEVSTNVGSNIIANIACGIFTAGLCVVATGIQYDVDCVFDQQKFQQYVYEWIQKHPFNREQILNLYSRQLALVDELNKDDRKIAELLEERYRRNNSYDNLISGEFPCPLSKCERILSENCEKLEKLKKEREYMLKVLGKKAYSLNDIEELVVGTQDNYLKTYLYSKMESLLRNVNDIHELIRLMITAKDRHLRDSIVSRIKKIIKDVKGDYMQLHLSVEEKKVLEPYIYEDAVYRNTFKSLESFKKLYPDSPHISEIDLKIRDLKHERILKSLIYNYNEWDEVKWIGRVDKDGWPTGKGKFLLKLFKSSYWAGKGVSLVTEVHTKVKHHKILSGTVDSQITVYHYYYLLFVPVGKSVLYKATTHRKFNGIRQMNDAIRATAVYLLAEAKGAITGSSTRFVGKCQSLYSLCTAYCSSGDSMCSQYCEEAGLMCNEGEMTDAIVHACYGICGNGDKCMNSCILKFRQKLLY